MMLKRVLRVGLGVIFFFVFLAFLFVSALKMRILAPSFWKISMEKGGVYEQLHTQVVNLRVKIEGSVKQQAGGKALPPDMVKMLTPILAMDKMLTSERFKELVETNLDRLLDYFNGNEVELLLYLPVLEWKLPVAALKQPALAKLNAQTPVEEVLPILGMKAEQIKSTVEGLGQIKIYLGYLRIVWIGLLILLMIIGVGHYCLGVGLIDRVSGTAWLLAISGFMAKLIGVGAGKIFEIMAVSSKPPLPEWGIELGRSLVGQFFNLGATTGLVVGLAGLGGVVTATYLSKQKKLKPQKEQLSRKQKVVAFVLGSVLGFVVLFVGIALAVVAVGGKVNLQNGDVAVKEVREEVPKLTSEVYKSERGWQIKFPMGWEVIKDEKSEGVMKKPTGTVTNWATMEIGPAERTKEIDSGEYLVAMKQGLGAATSFKNAKFVEEPYEEKQEETGLRRFVFSVDYDAVIANQTMRLRLFMVQYFLAKSGDGFVIMSRTPTESWDKYGGILKESVETFKMEK